MKGATESRVGSSEPARGIDRLHPAMRARMWQSGQSGNPAGHSGVYGEAIRLAQQAAPDAIPRLIELMDSDNERVAVVACNSILDRALGKPKVVEDDRDDVARRLQEMTRAERLQEAQRILEDAQRYLPAAAEIEGEALRTETADDRYSQS